jgi:hypothetical protein
MEGLLFINAMTEDGVMPKHLYLIRTVFEPQIYITS